MKRFPIILAVLSVVFNIILISFLVNRPKGASETGVEEAKFPYLSKRIFVENQNDILINFIPLRKSLRTYVESMKNPTGVYFEYLPSGVSIGVDEKENFISASLLKVPLVMAVFKEIEEGTLRLDQKLAVKEANIDPYFGELWKMGPGTEITVEQAINLVLTESDNTAKSVLFDSLKQESIDNVFDSLDIPKEREGTNPVVSPKNYSSILRSLYLSSYLKEENSNHVLDLLTKTIFTDKLPAGVPSYVKVAHKIGVYGQTDDSKAIYTDCGIIYIPKRPYILCIMARTNEEEATKIMIELSKTVYDYVSSINPPSK